MSKTIKVSELKEMVNHQLSVDCLSAEERIIIALLFADILHKTNNYQGYTYLPTESDIYAGPYGKDGKVRFF